MPFEYAVKDASDDTKESEFVKYAEYTNPTVEELLKTPSVANMVIFVNNIDWQVGFCKSLSTERSVRILVIVGDKSAFTRAEIHNLLSDTTTIRILRKIDDRLEEYTLHNSINTYSAHRWVFAERGSLSNLRYLPFTRLSNIDPNMVEVEIEATSANFRDVLNVLGSYIDRTISVDDFIGIDPGSIGGDIAGRVTRVGSDVSEFQTGDRVWGIGANSFGNFTTTHRSLLSKICSDSTISQSEYAAMPVVMMTTEYCVVDLGKVKRGDWVLVHSAAGGVGQCVIQYCNQIGATVVATCGSEDKRQLLRHQGVRYIFNSRDAELFASEYDEELQDKKIDVVINSLSDNYINYSASRLKSNGVFVEIGKRGIWSDDEMKKYRSDIEYHRVRLDEMIKTDPYSAGELLRRVNRRLNQATDPLRPLAITEYPMKDLVDAFRVLQRGENVGKIVLTNPTVTNKISNGTVLITGGTGALGCHLARWLSTKGYDDIHLLSRSGKFPDELSDLKHKVKSFAVDCTNELAVGGHIDKIDHIIGIVCCAGVLRDQLMPRTDAENERYYLSDYQIVWDMKVRSAEIIDRLSRNFDLDFFVTYSSVAATFGNPGQTNYSAANAALDALIERRNRDGLPGLSIQWGPWSLGSEQFDMNRGMNRGMATEQVRKQLEEQGIVAIDEMTGYAALDRWLNTQGIVAVMPKKRTEQMTNVVTTTFVLPSGTESEQKQWISKQIYETLKDITNVTLDMTDIESTPFMELGLDSLVSIEFRQSLVSKFGDIRLTSSVFFDYPSIRDLSKHIYTFISQNKHNAKSKIEQSSSDSSHLSMRQSIAITGMACRFPMASNYHEFWDNLVNVRDCIGDIPTDRYNIDDYYNIENVPNTIYTKQMGSVASIFDFDYKYFEMTRSEAESTDPQHRLALTLTREAIRDSGRNDESFDGETVDVYLGIETSDYSDCLRNVESPNHYSGTGSAFSCASGRISYKFNFKGASMSISTACSSSLVAIDLACLNLRTNRSNAAIAGGVNLVMSPQSHMIFCRINALSKNGHCCTFDNQASGYVRSEGGGILLLERESDAVEKNIPIHALIRGSSVREDGRSSTLTAPNGTAQQEVIRQALKESHLKPSDVDVIEAHGTGTPLGDPIELHAIDAVYGSGDRPLYVTGVKSNIGHLETAAGVAGVMKAVMMMWYGQVVPICHFTELNKNISLCERSRIMIPRTTQQLDTGSNIVRVGVSSFGFSGIISHLILESHLPIRSESELLERKTVSWQNMERVIHPLLMVDQKHYLRLTDVGSMTPNAVLLDHVVNNVAVFPGAGYVDAMLTFAKATCLNDIEFLQLLPVERLTLSKVSTNGAMIEFVADDSLYCRASLSDTSDTNIQQNFNPNEIPFQPIDGIYQRFADIGLQYGDAFQTIVGIHRESERSVLTHLRSKSKIVSTLDPTLLDGCFQSLAVLLSDSVDGTYVPHSIGRLFVAENKLYAESDDLYCRATWTNADWYHCTISADFEIYRNNHLFCMITNFVAKKVIGQSKSIASDTYVSEWMPFEYAVKDASDDTKESEFVKYAEYTNPTVEELLKTPSVANMVIFVNNIDWQVGFCKSLSTERSVRILVIVGDKSAFTRAEIHNLLSDTTTIRILRKIDDLIEELTIRNSINTYSAHRWVFAERGSLSNLRYLPNPRLSNIDPNMVEVEIEATSANFRDVLNVLGSYIDRTVSVDDFIGLDPGSIGGDIAGRVVRVGSDVSEFQLGDRVWGIGANSFGNFTTTHHSLLSKICSDSKITQSQYAAMPVVMMTTEYCMVDLGKVKRGDWVLVHSAAGGVGQCVIQYCNQIGATVVATCGSEDKRQLLRHQGVKYIFNSRDAELFASEYNEELQDKKIDVVINSLSDNYINYSASRLKSNGVFIEIGKRGIWSDDEMKKYRSDIEYHRVRLDEMIKTDPYSAGDLLRRVNRRFCVATDPLRPLAITEYPMNDLVDALRVLQRGENVGKIVLTNPTVTNKISNGTVLITGGTGALGCHLARWLSTKGYDDIHLLSRSGKFPDELSDLNQKVKSFAVDCTDESAVIGHIDKIAHVIGIVCCAGVLRDQLMPRTDAEIERYLSDYQMVWDTKVRSAEIIDRLSRNFDLDFFVTYSSVAATFGNTGQTNYSAANAALDALVERRNQNGLPGLSIQWGPWNLESEKTGIVRGMATEQVRKYLEEQGIVAIDVMMGYTALDRWFNTQGIVAVMPRKQAITNNTNASIGFQLPPGTVSEQKAFVAEQIYQTLKEITNITSDLADIENIPFMDLGLDSLVSIEFRQSIGKRFDLTVSNTLLFDYPTIAAATVYIFETIQSQNCSLTDPGSDYVFSHNLSDISSSVNNFTITKQGVASVTFPQSLTKHSISEIVSNISSILEIDQNGVRLLDDLTIDCRRVLVGAAIVNIFRMCPDCTEEEFVTLKRESSESGLTLLRIETNGDSIFLVNL
jgi:NADPH:quinone reductase-like Zn-dependent oxidoreductase/3-oxoacyl-(acyl-carrier-protein) synthase/acyl carrier protein